MTSSPVSRGTRLTRASRRTWSTTLALLLLPALLAADPRPQKVMDAADIRLALDKLNVVGSALLIGAHPDDENAPLLAWLSKGQKVRTAYLSLTRGDGGQNLIGADASERLGVIRTQELIGARRVDGAEQFFGRAIDFGFSKNSDETMVIWDHDRTLWDAVWVIRQFRPDLVIARFPTDSTAGHGHHSASAIIAAEAFTAAADPTKFPDQLKWVKPWQAKRLVRNIGRFGNQPPDTTPGRIAVDLGAYNILLGRSYTEIGGESRSLHKTQGFGSAERRGAWTNTFEHKAGPQATRDLFEGVDLTWARIPGGSRLSSVFTQAAKEFRADRPAAIVPLLLRAHTMLATLGDDPLVETKRREVMAVLQACTGLWLEANATTPAGSPAGRVRIVTSALNRSDVPIRVESIDIGRGNDSAPLAHVGARALAFNVAATDTSAFELPRDLPLSTPYWLRKPALRGSFDVDDPALIGTAENAPVLSARFLLTVAGTRLGITVPVVQRSVDPVLGERYRPFEIVPPAAMAFERGAYLFADDRPRDLRLTVRTTGSPVSGDVSLRVPAGWTASPAKAAVQLAGGEADTTLAFTVTPGASAGAGTFGAEITTETGRYTSGIVRLDYPHTPIQTLLPPAEARIVRTDLKTTGRDIAYLMGSGDEVPDALGAMGYTVTMLTDDDVAESDLSRYDAVVVGVRAYNTRRRLRTMQRRLLDYVANGGRLVMQYQRPEPGIQDRLGPWPLQFSNDRVTVEEAPITLLKPDHPLLTTPNRIGPADFEGWVQERGTYFSNKWDPRYEALMSSNDPREPAREGGMLVAAHGKGTFIYTGYAFFRQLPAGVPGAWRLFANLVSNRQPEARGTPASRSGTN